MDAWLPLRRPGAPPAAGEAWRPALLGLALAALALLPALVAPPPLNTAHEARFPLLARDMLTRRVWFPDERGVLYRNKPPLYVWSIAAVSAPGRAVSLRTALVPVVAAALVAVLFTSLLGTRLFGPRAGAWAGAVLATSYLFFVFARTPVPDMLVVCFGTVAVYAAWRALEAPPGRAWLVLLYGALGLAFATKGPVGLLPLLPVAVWLAALAGGRALRRLWSGPGVALFAALTLGWLLPYLARGAEGVAEEVVGSGLQSYFGLPRPATVGGQLVRALAGLLPWALVLPLALAAAVRARRTPAVGFALAWCLVPLGAVLLSETQHTRYLLPLYPGAALLVARWLETDGAQPTRVTRGLAVLAVAGIAVALTAPIWTRPSPRTFLPTYAGPALGLYAGLAALALLLGRALWTGWSRRLVLGVAGLTAVLLVYGGTLHARWLARMQDFPGLAARLERLAPGTAVGAAGTDSTLLQLDFHLGRGVVPLAAGPELLAYLGRPERPIAVVGARAWRELAPPPPASVQVLDRWVLAGRELVIVRVGG